MPHPLLAPASAAAARRSRGVPGRRRGRTRALPAIAGASARGGPSPSRATRTPGKSAGPRPPAAIVPGGPPAAVAAGSTTSPTCRRRSTPCAARAPCSAPGIQSARRGSGPPRCRSPRPAAVGAARRSARAGPDACEGCRTAPRAPGRSKRRTAVASAAASGKRTQGCLPPGPTSRSRSPRSRYRARSRRPRTATAGRGPTESLRPGSLRRRGESGYGNDPGRPNPEGPPK